MDITVLKISTVQGCKDWLAALPLTNAQQAHSALSAQVRMLNAATLVPAARLQILEDLREPVAFVQGERAKRFCNQPVPLDTVVASVWNEVIALWHAMSQGYEACAGTDSKLLSLVYQRALDYAGLAMRDHNRIYRAIPPALWLRLHKLFAVAEAAGFADVPVSDTVNRNNQSTTCTATYIEVLLAQHATPDALTQSRITAVDRWLKQWSSFVTLAQVASPAGAVFPMAVIFGTGAGARDGKEVRPAPNVRYLELGRLGAILVKMIAGLRSGKSPADLGLGTELRQPACETLLLLLHTQWCGVGTGRTEERSPSALKVMVSTSIAAMHFHLTGRPFRQPGAPLSRREEDDLQMFGHVSDRTERALLSQRSGALETWEVVNHSRSGVLGMCRQPDAATRISHNQLLGLRTAAGTTFYLGIVQRLLVDDSGAVSIGLRVIPGTPQPIAACIRGMVAADGNKYDRALLMPADEKRNIPASLIMAPASYQPNRQVDLYIDVQKPVKLTSLLDKGVNFDRVTYGEP